MIRQRRFRSVSMFLLLTQVIGSAWSGGLAAHESVARPLLVFSIDQGFPNGPIENNDLETVQREIDSLKVFRSKYQIYALVSGAIKNHGYLQNALDLLVQNKMPFFLEAASSDAITIDAGMAVQDRSHGLEVSIVQLQQYKQRYGEYFRGIRLFELFAQNWTIWAGKFRGEPWGDRYRQYWPHDDFYQTALIEPYVRFAASHHMLVIFADWYWHFDHQAAPADLKQPQHESELQSLIQKFPDVVVVMYDNNEPSGHSNSVDWVPAFQQYLGHGAKGFGLSDQAWLCDNESQCPLELLESWAASAYRQGAMMVQIEPYWYWWDLPRGGLEQNNYYQYKSAEERGKATDRLFAFAAALGIDTAQQSTRSAGNPVPGKTQ